jgi:uncharacterized protein YndB with AHSA1/START domain
MIRIEHELVIERPRREVFEFLADVDNLPQWQSGAVQSQLLTDLPLRAGSRFSETVRMGPLTVHTTCVVTELEPDKTFAFEAMSRPLDYAGSFRLSDVEGSTRLTMHAVAHLKGFWRLLEPLLGSDLRKEARSELEALQRILQATPVA